MPRHKDFSGGMKLDDYEPLTFTLNGEQFTAKPAVQGAVLLEFVASADSENGGAAAQALYQFFERVLDEENYARFQALLTSDEIIIDMELIGEIAGWLIEEYAERPTRPSPSSAGGQVTSGPASTDGTSSQAEVA